MVIHAVYIYIYTHLYQPAMYYKWLRKSMWKSKMSCRHFDIFRFPFLSWGWSPPLPKSQGFLKLGCDWLWLVVTIFIHIPYWYISWILNCSLDYMNSISSGYLICHPTFDYWILLISWISVGYWIVGMISNFWDDSWRTRSQTLTTHSSSRSLYGAGIHVQIPTFTSFSDCDGLKMIETINITIETYIPDQLTLLIVQDHSLVPSLSPVDFSRSHQWMPPFGFGSHLLARSCLPSFKLMCQHL